MSYNVRFFQTYHQARFEESTFGHKILYSEFIFIIGTGIGVYIYLNLS